jgi:amidase
MASLKAKRLRIGFLVDDGVVKVQPPIARAVQEVVAALKAAGHEGMFIALLFTFASSDE